MSKFKAVIKAAANSFEKVSESIKVNAILQDRAKQITHTPKSEAEKVNAILQDRANQITRTEASKVSAILRERSEAIAPSKGVSR